MVTNAAGGTGKVQLFLDWRNRQKMGRISTKFMRYAISEKLSSATAGALTSVKVTSLHMNLVTCLPIEVTENCQLRCLHSQLYASFLNEA